MYSRHLIIRDIVRYREVSLYKLPLVQQLRMRIYHYKREIHCENNFYLSVNRFLRKYSNIKLGNSPAIAPREIIVVSLFYIGAQSLPNEELNQDDLIETEVDLETYRSTSNSGEGTPYL